ncbi:unnamed protein product [Moneuplotes crassus]|uniref:Uncharacterized protein n=1 Tax=Euplotes crassus TaxID=5936 RepID=A0AAD2DAI7_EUPCR|nr:unnamed protein product [Moneuplotes crassus]
MFRVISQILSYYWLIFSTKIANLGERFLHSCINLHNSDQANRCQSDAS